MREGRNRGGLTRGEWRYIVALRHARHRIYAVREDGNLAGHLVDGVRRGLKWARLP